MLEVNQQTSGQCHRKKDQTNGGDTREICRKCRTELPRCMLTLKPAPMVQSLFVHNQPLDDLQLRARQEDIEAWRRPAVGACRMGKHAAGGTDELLPHAIVVPLCRACSSAESLKSFIGVAI